MDPSRKLGLAQLLLIKDRNETGRKLESPRARLIRKASAAGLLATSPAYRSQERVPTLEGRSLRKVAHLDHDTMCPCYAGSGDHVRCISYASRISIQIMWMALV